MAGNRCCNNIIRRMLSMPLVKLMENEHFLIEAIRQFDFLRDYGYRINGALIHYLEYELSFISNKAKREIHLWWVNNNRMNISIVNYNKFIPKIILADDLYSYFKADYLSNKIESIDFHKIIEKYARFARGKLLPIISGDVWIQSIERRKK